MQETHGEGASALLKLDGITKRFASNIVLKGVSLEVNGGDVLAIIGGNGAGKSTLMKILMGIYTNDEGTIYINGQDAKIHSPAASLHHGIYMVPQEPMLFPNMTVEDNVLLGFRGARPALRERLSKLIKELGWSLTLDTKADNLTIADQQLVELLRGMMRDAKILILDEPTSALTFSETESLFKIVRDLQSQGICIFYITHRLTEVFEIANRVIILRDGTITMDGAVREFTQADLIAGLLPPSTHEAVAEEKAKDKNHTQVDYENETPVLKIENFSGYGFEGVNLGIYKNEILGIAGVVGAGRTELAETIFGITEPISGKVYLDGKDITGFAPYEVIKQGVNYVPEDRRLNAIFGIRDVTENVSAGVQDKYSKILSNDAKERELSEQYVKDFRIKVTGLGQLIASLSGGNQQKVVLAKTLATDPKVVIFDEPTRGIDAAARGDVYKIIEQLRKSGVAVVIISSDIEEVVEMSDRVVTMFHGRVNASFVKEEITLDNLMSASFGVVKEGEEAV